MSSSPQASGASGSFLGRTSTWCFEHRRIVLAVWVAVVVVTMGAGVGVGASFTDEFSGGGSDAAQARDLLQQRFPQESGASVDVVFRTNDQIADDTVQQHIARVAKALSQESGVAQVTAPDPSDPVTARQIGRDGHIGYATVRFDQSIGNIDKAEVTDVIDTARSFDTSGLQVEVGGRAAQLMVQQGGFGPSEVVGLAAAAIILLVAFGSLIAMGLPIFTALAGLGGGIGTLYLLSHLLSMPTYAPELAIMIGLGVGIDYSLFIVTRHRETLHAGADASDSASTAMTTAGRAVIFAGSTVVISLLGLFLLGLPFIYGLAVGAIAAVIFVMLGSLTLLPSMLGFAGTNIDRFGIQRFLHRGEGGRKTLSYRWSRVVQKHSWLAFGGSFVALLLLAVPLLSMHQSFPDAGNEPTSLTTRRAYDLLSEGFGPGINGPLIVAVALPESGSQAEKAKADLGQLVEALNSTDGVAVATPPQFNQADNAATVFVVPTSSPQAESTKDLVGHLRHDIIDAELSDSGATAYVGGLTAASVDSTSQLSARLPLVLAAVIAVSFLLLMAVFRSIAVPIKAAVMNLLSIGAAYGVIVAVFQWGWLSSIFSVAETAPIAPWIPLAMFTILFGLSMDYEVFLLSRIREEWLRTGDNTSAVADGLAGTARVITSAAAIMVCVFASFIFTDIRVLKVLGLGLASAVFLDASLVRLVLVPATMELLGRANWWFPSWLDRLVPDPGLERPPEAASASGRATADV